MKKNGKSHPYKIIIELNMQMRQEVNFINSQRMLEWDGIKVTFCQETFLE